MTRTAVPLPPLLGIPLRRLHDLDEATRLEWVEADGRGGYAAGTAAGANTRRAHGLVVASVQPAERLVLLARVEETVVLDDGARFDPGVAFYPDAVHPTGYTLLQSFALDPWPMWRWRVGDIEIVKELFVARRTGATVLRYQVRGADVLLELRPLFAGRATGAIRTANEEVRTEAEASERLVAYQAYDDVPAVVLSFATGRWEARQDWYYRTVYPRDGAADEAREDLFCPGVLRLPLDGEAPTVLACGLRPARVAFAATWVSDELLRRGRIADAGRAATHDDERLSELGARLGLAADAFLIERAGGRSIVAGYPEPAERTTAALIALPGLCLATGRPEAAAAVLRTIAQAMREGMVPDALDRPFDADAAMPETGLWFVEAVARLHAAGGDARPFLAAMHATLARLERGWPGIRLAPDGLLERTVVAAATPLDGTNESVQPGRGVAVNALWYNALLRAATLDAADARAAGYRATAERCERAFESFWFADGAYLFDRIGPAGERDAALRAGQLLAVALPHSMVEAGRARKVVDIIDRELVVPLGVRTRTPRDTGHTHNGERERAAGADAWPWLLAHFARAYLRVYGDDPHTRERLRRIAFEFASHLDDAGLGHVAERFGAEPPYRPAGRVASAMSCAAVLEMLALTTTTQGGVRAGAST